MIYFLIHISIFLAAFGILYRDALAHTLQKVLTPEGSHVALVFAVSAFLVWLKRKDLKAIPVRPAILPGTLLLGLGCLMLSAGKLGNAMVLQQISMIPTLLGAVWLFLGFGHLKALFIPVGYLLFGMGIIEDLLGNVAFYLQLMSAWIASHLLLLTGMPVLLKGTFVELPHINLEVARECSGINHIVMVVALAVLLAYTIQRTLAKRFILVLSAMLIGIFANGLRVALIGIYALIFPGVNVHGPAQSLYVTFIFFFGMVVVIALNHLLIRGDLKRSQLEHDKLATPADSPTEEAPAFQLPAAKAEHAKMSFAPLAAFVMISFATLGFMHLSEARPIPLKNPLKAFPIHIAGFTGKELDQIDQRFRPFSADDELLRVYENAEGKKIELYIGYYETQDRERKVVDYRRDWMHHEAVPVPVGPSGNSIYINQTHLNRQYDPRTVYFWYDMDGKIITSRYEGKIRSFLGPLVNRRTNAAVVVINTRNSEKDIMPFIGELVSVAHAHLSGT